MMKKSFFVYGLIGWCVEVIWTGVGSFLQGDMTLKSQTSLWMFFVYGLAVLLEPVHDRIRHWPVWMRGSVYTILIFAIEYTTGQILSLLGICPWDYTGARWAIQGMIRLDYAPAWFLASLLFEKFHDFLLHYFTFISQPEEDYS